MKKFLIVASVCIGFAFSAKAQHLEFVNLGENNTLDYGEIQPNSDGLRIVKIKNTGNAPLIISNVKASCGCTVPSFEKDPVMPGKTAEIQVKYATGRQGPINKVITVTSNSVDSPTALIRMKGKVLETTEPQPAQASLQKQ